MIHDGEIVRSEVPDHIHVVLEEAKIDAQSNRSSRACPARLRRLVGAIFFTAPVNRKVWSTMILRFFLPQD